MIQSKMAKRWKMWVNISSRLGQVHACVYSNFPKFTFCSSLVEAGKFPRILLLIIIIIIIIINKQCPLSWICPHRVMKVRKWIVAPEVRRAENMHACPILTNWNDPNTRSVDSKNASHYITSSYSCPHESIDPSDSWLAFTTRFHSNIACLSRRRRK